MNKHYYTKSLGNILLDVTTINRNFRIKVHGLVNGQKWNKLVGVAGRLACTAQQRLEQARKNGAPRVQQPRRQMCV